MLIETTDQLRDHIPASYGLDIDDLRPKLKMVEREVIIKHFPLQLYELVHDGGENDAQEALRDLLAEAVAHLALYHHIDVGQVQISSSGIHINSTDTSKTAFEWQISNLKKSALRQGWQAVESAFLLLNSTEDAELKQIWEQSATYLALKNSLLPTLEVFQQFVSLDNSFMMFKKLSPLMREIQEEFITDLLGIDLLEKLLDAPAGKYREVLTRSRRVLAYKAMAMGMVNTMLVMSDNGPLIIEGLTNLVVSNKRTVPIETASIIADNYRKRAATATKDLLAFCQKNVKALPEFAISENYVEPGESHLPDNDPEWGSILL